MSVKDGFVNVKKIKITEDEVGVNGDERGSFNDNVSVKEAFVNVKKIKSCDSKQLEFNEFGRDLYYRKRNIDYNRRGVEIS